LRRSLFKEAGVEAETVRSFIASWILIHDRALETFISGKADIEFIIPGCRLEFLRWLIGERTSWKVVAGSTISIIRMELDFTHGRGSFWSRNPQGGGMIFVLTGRSDILLHFGI
jgi:hypothetical protein